MYLSKVAEVYEGNNQQIHEKVSPRILVYIQVVNGQISEERDDGKSD